MNFPNLQVTTGAAAGKTVFKLRDLEEIHAFAAELAGTVRRVIVAFDDIAGLEEAKNMDPSEVLDQFRADLRNSCPGGFKVFTRIGEKSLRVGYKVVA